jgi:hypothetical protein
VSPQRLWWRHKLRITYVGVVVTLTLFVLLLQVAGVLE